MMTEELTKPLNEKHIKAATALYEKLEYWQRKNTVLDNLKKLDPHLFDPHVTLLKVAAINQFYYTNLWAIDRMADHIVDLRIMGGLYNPEAKEQHASLVEEIALLKNLEAEDPQQVSDTINEGEIPKDPDQLSTSKKSQEDKHRRHISFASKFAHFFISKENFPIYDSYAESMVVFHLHGEKRFRDEKHLYKSFFMNLDRLLNWANLSCSFEELDRYLWLAGLFRVWLDDNSAWADDSKEWEINKDAKINREVKVLFNLPASKSLLRQLFPYIRGKGNNWTSLEQKGNP